MCTPTVYIDDNDGADDDLSKQFTHVLRPPFSKEDILNILPNQNSE
jgi:hypothetical protein